MPTIKKINWTMSAFTALLFLIFFSSCNRKTVQPVIYTPPAVKEQQTQFFLSWLAECTSDTAVATTDSLLGLQALTTLGRERISAAVTNPILIGAFGNYGTTAVWGPALKVSFPGDTAVLTDNLLYVVKSAEGDSITYTIGVSGTNAISFFGWFAEDFNVSTTVPWIDAKGVQQGAIAAGSNLGLDILMGLDDQNNTNILTFLKGELTKGKQNTNYKIVVTGHSLGGALSPLLALRLKEQLTSANLKVSVEAWPYAGPTPGDTTFAKYLIKTLDAYHAFNNQFDVVAHVWEQDSLDRLCDLYVRQETACGFSLNAKEIVQGFAQWAIGQSKKSGVQYQIAGTPTVFKGSQFPVKLKPCETAMELAIGLDVEYPAIFKLLKGIAQQCGTTNENELVNALNYFILYFLDLGYQHTGAYEQQFFPDSTVAAAVDQYVGGGSLTSEGSYIGPIFGELLLEIETYLKTNNITDCNCPNAGK